MPDESPALENIVVTALEKHSLEEREAYLDTACGGNTELRRQIERLLKVESKVGDFLEKSPLNEVVVDPAKVSSLRQEPSQSADAATSLASGGYRDASLDFLRPCDKPDRIGLLGPYEIMELVGQGGLGIVFKALDLKLNRVVAIKVPSRQYASNATAGRRFLREAQAAAAVSHDHVVTIHAVDENDGQPYLVMEYVHGMPLQQRIDRDGPLDLKAILRIGMQTALGLAAAHAQGLIHRDIKPSNILLENDVERVKITDFGLARGVDDMRITRTGEVAGTPEFMSPEQAAGEHVDHRSDLFSLGSVIYAMCAGRPPFRAETTYAVLRRVCEDTPRPLREVNSDIPSWLVTIVERLLAKKPEDRFQSAAEVAELLGAKLADLQYPMSARELADPFPSPLEATVSEMPCAEPPRRRLWWRLTATSLLVVAAIVISIKYHDGTEQRIEVPQRSSVMITEADDPLVTPAPKPEREAFVVMDDKRGEARFDTLAEAVAVAKSGDTIEIHGNGPFVTKGVNVGTRALTIRAGDGFRPVIRLSRQETESPQHLLVCQGRLVLEGLEFQRLRGEGAEKGWPRTLTCRGGPLYLAHCRFVQTTPKECLVSVAVNAELRHCEILTDRSCLLNYGFTTGGQLVVDNCLLAGGSVILHRCDRDASGGVVKFTRNTFVGKDALFIYSDMLPELPATGGQTSVVRIEASGSVLAAPESVMRFEQSVHESKLSPLSPGDAVSFMSRELGWRGERNIYDAGGALVGLSVNWAVVPSPLLGEGLTHWKQFWGSVEGGSGIGRVRFQGGVIRAMSTVQLEQLTPEDFRLRPDSAGYRADPDGRDLGADIDQVGPGEAYERWKETPEYQRWLKSTGQLNVNKTETNHDQRGAETDPERAESVR